MSFDEDMENEIISFSKSLILSEKVELEKI